ncbi:MAG: MBL fold metallo-hydrolase, partial [Actinobacteria bacterium]|nr:MBL fold metallo-hydrolase [Actinomycetota bacterium]
TTHIADINFSFNQYLIAADEPLLFHTGGRQLFPLVKDAVAKVLPPETIQWISFGHVESDECGSMNEWLAVSPGATVGASATACMVSLNDLCDRTPMAFDNAGESYDLGGHMMRWFDTPHVPHGWEAGVLYDATTKTLFCGDLFTQVGDYAATSSADIIEPASQAEDMYHAWALAPDSGTRVRALAELDIANLALMHGPVFTGNAKEALVGLADDIERRISVVG